ncbi:MAG: hypothetical protein M3313_12630 [Actinomycetota bacterium]|nr:hypothetical protein [Actinomycetota bacterium]
MAYAAAGVPGERIEISLLVRSTPAATTGYRWCGFCGRAGDIVRNHPYTGQDSSSLHKRGRVDRSAPGLLAAEQGLLEAFLSLPLSKIDPGTDDGRDEEVRRMLAPDRQRGLDGGVTFNSGI